MFTVDSYISSIKSNLDKQSYLLIENLKKIIAYNFSADINLLDFSAFIEPTRFELSIMMFSMDKEGNEVFYEGNDSTIFAGSAEVLSEIEFHSVSDNQLNDFFDFYEQNEDTIVQEERDTFTNWFKKCWEKADGQILDLPSYFGLHDDSNSFDLKSNQWIDDEEKWS